VSIEKFLNKEYEIKRLSICLETETIKKQSNMQ